MYAMMKTVAACLRLHGYWGDINSRAWLSVRRDWNHSTQSSNNKLSPLPFLPSAFSGPAASHSSRGAGDGETGGGSPSSFLSSTSCLAAFVISHRRRARACHLLRQGSRLPVFQPVLSLERDFFLPFNAAPLFNRIWLKLRMTVLD